MVAPRGSCSPFTSANGLNSNALQNVFFLQSVTSSPLLPDAYFSGLTLVASTGPKLGANFLTLSAT